MSTIGGKNAWLTSHYEKAILLVVLLALIGVCSLLPEFGGDAQNSLQALLTTDGQVVSPKGVEAFDEALAAAAGRRVEGSEETPAWVRNITVSEVRVACVSCGQPIPFDAMECPSCKAEQPKIIDARSIDTDGDGIPDVIENEWGLNPEDPMDAFGDLDGDGFTNLEEYLEGTDSKNSTEHPPLLVKLRVARIREVPFNLRYVGKSEIAPGVFQFQFNLGERTYFEQLGASMGGYDLKDEGKTPGGADTITLVRKRDGRRVELIKGRPVSQPEYRVRFGSLADKRVMAELGIDETFTFDTIPYKVVDIARDGVKIQDTTNADAEVVTVPIITSAERAALQAPASPTPTAKR
jgi:hypothetical protein